MNRRKVLLLLTAAAVLSAVSIRKLSAQAPSVEGGARILSAEDCTEAKLGSSIPVSAIGEPVAAVTLAAPRWVAANGAAPAYCSILGVFSSMPTKSHIGDASQQSRFFVRRPRDAR